MTAAEFMAQSWVQALEAALIALFLAAWPLYLWYRYSHLPDKRHHMKMEAQKFAMHSWYIHGVESHDTGVFLDLASVEVPRRQYSLFFRSYHPDVRVIKVLKHLDIVKFGWLEEPITPQLAYEITAYLRLRERTGTFS